MSNADEPVYLVPWLFAQRTLADLYEVGEKKTVAVSPFSLIGKLECHLDVGRGHANSLNKFVPRR
jgi:hypothetical protein